MLSARYISTAPDSWVSPRPASDACTRRLKYGPLRPMDYGGRGLLNRLFGR